ncbi:hypothetical protein BJ170DRAFT_628304 [Xylariales sp. AK1849]|nr:hypothetical protein BJ170DRAFT_628304 [Xylariales sp. AK1849]
MLVNVCISCLGLSLSVRTSPQLYPEQSLSTVCWSRLAYSCVGVGKSTLVCTVSACLPCSGYFRTFPNRVESFLSLTPALLNLQMRFHFSTKSDILPESGRRSRRLDPIRFCFIAG